MSSETHSPIPITVKVTPELPDFVSFNLRFRFLRSRGIVLYSLILLSVFLYTAYTVQKLAIQVPPGPIRYVGIASLLAVPVGVLVFLPVGTYLAARRQWRAAPDLREPREYTFTDEGVRVVGATFAGFVAWSNVTTAVRTGGQVLLGTGQQFFLVPLWAFNTTEEGSRFCELVATKVAGCRL